MKTPVNLKIGYTPTHYGPNAVDEANELAAQLNDSGLFKVTTDAAEWEEYQTLYKEGAYDLFMLGWYPDILDADNYLTPFLRDGGFYANNYSSDEVNQLLDQELAETDTGARDDLIGQIQDIVAEDVPVDPVLERPERRRGDHGDGGRRGDSRPDLHLPSLGHQQERLSTTAGEGVHGRALPFPCQEGMPP